MGFESTVQSSRGVGLRLPLREADCSGVRPSWSPFAVNVCDEAEDWPDPVPFVGRQLRVLPPVVVSGVSVLYADATHGDATYGVSG